jgi:hypothetical protein
MLSFAAELVHSAYLYYYKKKTIPTIECTIISIKLFETIIDKNY